MKIEKKMIDRRFCMKTALSAIILWTFLYFFGFVIGEAFYNFFD